MRVPILCYHKVGPLEEEGRRLNVAPETLASHLAFFSRRGWRFVRAVDLEGRWPGRSVCLTFDDAYRSTLTHGLEALRRAGAVASIYAVPKAEGMPYAPGSSDWDFGHERPLASADELTAAQDAGIEIGNHTLTHANLSGLDEEGQARELMACHRALEAIGIHVRTVAYPYGRHSAATRTALERCGYGLGVALGRRWASESDEKWRLPRIVVGFGDRLPRLIYKLWVQPHLPSTRRRSHYVR